MHLSATIIALVSSSNPSSSGQNVTFTATVTPEAGGKPTGLVNFYIDGTIPIGTGTLSDWSSRSRVMCTVTLRCLPSESLVTWLVKWPDRPSPPCPPTVRKTPPMLLR